MTIKNKLKSVMITDLWNCPKVARKLNNTIDKQIYLPLLDIPFPSNISGHSNISIFNLISVNKRTADINSLVTYAHVSFQENKYTVFVGAN